MIRLTPVSDYQLCIVIERQYDEADDQYWYSTVYLVLLKQQTHTHTYKIHIHHTGGTELGNHHL